MNHRILVLDDEEAVLLAVSEYFSLRGFAVDCAREKKEAEVFLEERDYEAVIIDLRLTGSQSTEGLEIIETVGRRKPATRTILLTADGSPQIEAEAERLGVDALLSKSRPLREVAQIVIDLIAEHRQARST